jgi:hypothetical protein
VTDQLDHARRRLDEARSLIARSAPPDEAGRR